MIFHLLPPLLSLLLFPLVSTQHILTNFPKEYLQRGQTAVNDCIAVAHPRIGSFR